MARYGIPEIAGDLSAELSRVYIASAGNDYANIDFGIDNPYLEDSWVDYGIHGQANKEIHTAGLEGQESLLADVGRKSRHVASVWMISKGIELSRMHIVQENISIATTEPGESPSSAPTFPHRWHADATKLEDETYMFIANYTPLPRRPKKFVSLATGYLLGDTDDLAYDENGLKVYAPEIDEERMKMLSLWPSNAQQRAINGKLLASSGKILHTMPINRGPKPVKRVHYRMLVHDYN